MTSKRKPPADETSDGELAAAIRESAHNIWLAGLGAFAMAQEEGEKLFDTLVKEGETLQRRAKKAADAKVAEMNETAGTTWDKLEQVFEDRVARALHSLSVPTKQDIDALSERVAELTKVVKKLSATQGPQAPKPRARRTTKSAK